jgi:hypothetical protein
MDWPTVVLVLGWAAICAYSVERLAASALAAAGTRRRSARRPAIPHSARRWRLTRRVFILLVIGASLLAAELALRHIIEFRRLVAATPSEAASPDAARAGLAP